MKNILREKRVGRGGLSSYQFKNKNYQVDYQIEDFKRRLKNIEKIKPLFMEKGYTEECFNDTIAPHILMSKDKALSEYAQSPIFSAIFS